MVLRDRSCMYAILITCLDGVADPAVSDYPSTEDLYVKRWRLAERVGSLATFDVTVNILL